MHLTSSCCAQSGKGHHISKSKSRVHGPLLASRGIVAAYPKAVKLSHLMSHAKHYLLHDTLLVRYQLNSASLHTAQCDNTGKPIERLAHLLERRSQA